jgi:hypothetical protein
VKDLIPAGCLVLALSLASGGAAQTSRKPAGLFFAGYSAILESSSFKTVEQFLKLFDFPGEGFTRVDKQGWFWQYAGTDGVFSVAWDQETIGASLTLEPTSPAALGDAALATLMNKATSVDVSMDGTAVVVTLLGHPQSTAGRTVLITDVLSFKLDGGRWFRTDRFIRWVN